MRPGRGRAAGPADGAAERRRPGDAGCWRPAATRARAPPRSAPISSCAIPMRARHCMARPRARAGSLAGAAVASADRPVAARDDGGATAPPVAVRSPVAAHPDRHAPAGAGQLHGAGRRRPLGAVPRRRGARGRAPPVLARRATDGRACRWRWPWCRRSRTRASSACCAPPSRARAAGSAFRAAGARSRRAATRAAAGPRC